MRIGALRNVPRASDMVGQAGGDRALAELADQLRRVADDGYSPMQRVYLEF
jgi:hypothetical protein